MSCPVELDCPFYPACQRESWYIQARTRADTPKEAEQRFRDLALTLGYEALNVSVHSVGLREYEGSIQVAPGSYRVVSQAWWDKDIAEQQAEALRRLTGQAGWHVIEAKLP